MCKEKKDEWYYLIFGAKLSGANLDKLDYLGLAFRDEIPEITDILFVMHLNAGAIDTFLDWKMPMLKNFRLTKEQIEKMKLVTYSPDFYERIVNTRDLKPYVDTLEDYSKYIQAKYRREIGSVLCSQSGYIVIVNIDATNIYFMEISKEIADMSEQKLKKYVIDVLANRTQAVCAMTVFTFDAYFWNLYKTIDIKKEIAKLK